MKFHKHLLLCATAGLMLSTTGQAQEWVFEDVTVPVGSTTASVNWTYTGGGGSSQNTVDIPGTNGIITGIADLSNCILVEDADNTSCLDNGGTIRITMLNFDTANELGDASGTIVFSIDPAATDGQSGVVDATEVAGGFDVVPTITDGSVTVQAGPPAVLDVTPPSIDFGSGISPTTLGPETVTIANTGSAGAPDVNVSNLAFSGADAGQFSITGGSCAGTAFAVAAGTSCTVDIELAVNAVATFNADFDVTADVANASVALTGEGTAGPVASFSINPATAAFGQVDLNDLPQSIVHTVTNDGDPGSTLELTSVTLGGTPEFSLATDCPATLAQGVSCTVTVTFNTGAVGGPFADTVTAVTNVGTFEVPVSGEAVAQAVLDVNPPFGPVDLGQGPAGSIITANGTFSNTGSADGDVACNITGPDAAIFTATPSAGTIPAGGTVGFELACRLPDGAEQGDVFTADLNCSSPDDAAFDGVHNLSCGVQEFQSVPVPTMQPWALVLFSMLMLIAGGIGIRFFRAG